LIVKNFNKKLTEIHSEQAKIEPQENMFTVPKELDIISIRKEFSTTKNLKKKFVSGRYVI
jgi:hypothetical protein